MEQRHVECPACGLVHSFDPWAPSEPFTCTCGQEIGSSSSTASSQPFDKPADPYASREASVLDRPSLDLLR